MTDSIEYILPQIITAFMAAVCLMILLAPAVFADDADGSDGVILQAAGTETSVTVSIICSDHGSVNDKTGEFTEEVSSGGDLHMEFAAEEGYVIGCILINDEPLAAADIEGIAGEQAGTLDLEGLEENMSLQVVFMTPEDYADQEISPGTADDPASGSGSDDPGTDTPSDDSDSTDPAGQDGDETSVDPLPSDDNAGAIDDGDESFEPDDNWGTEDDELAPQDDEYQGTEDDPSETGSQEFDDSTAGSDTGSENNSEADSDFQNETDSTDTVKSVGTAASTTVNNEDDGSDGKGDYKGDYDTPKTGDESLVPAEALLMIGLGFLCLSCIIAIRSDEKAEGGDGE